MNTARNILMASALMVWCILAVYLTATTEGYPRGSVDLDTPTVGR